jgi:hypothetical protein
VSRLPSSWNLSGKRGPVSAWILLYVFEDNEGELDLCSSDGLLVKPAA